MALANDERTQREALTNLLDGVSDAEIHEMSIAALRMMRRRGKLQDGQVEVHSAYPSELIPLLETRKGVTLESSWGRAPFFAFFEKELERPYMAPVFNFVVWMMRAGLAWPLQLSQQSTPIRLRLTRAGERFVAHEGDHPLLPGYVKRIRERCPGLPEPVTSLLVQSKACLDFGLMRPAISLMGVAYEVAVEEVIEKLIKRHKLPANVRTFTAAPRIAAVKAQIDALIPGKRPKQKEERFAAHHAYDFADRLRSRRNDASHATPAHGFEDRQEAEEFLISAGRHLPNLWRVARAKP